MSIPLLLCKGSSGLICKSMLVPGQCQPADQGGKVSEGWLSKGHWIATQGRRICPGEGEDLFDEGQFDFSAERAHSLTQQARHCDAITSLFLISSSFPPFPCSSLLCLLLRTILAEVYHRTIMETHATR